MDSGISGRSRRGRVPSGFAGPSTSSSCRRGTMRASSPPSKELGDISSRSARIALATAAWTCSRSSAETSRSARATRAWTCRARARWASAESTLERTTASLIGSSRFCRDSVRSASYSPSASPRFDPISADPTALFRPRACRGTTIVPPRRKPVILEIRERSGADRLAGSDGDSAPRGARVPRSRRGSANRNEVFNYLGGLLAPNEYEREADAHGRLKWTRDTTWQTTGLVKAGWLVKDGQGKWTATEAGLRALREFSDPAAFYRESDRLYQEWKASQPEPARQRAWLVRGFSVLGANIVPEWLAHGFCSLAASQLRTLEPDVPAQRLREQAAEDYSHLTQQPQKSRVDEIVNFVVRMATGDRRDHLRRGPGFRGRRFRRA